MSANKATCAHVRASASALSAAMALRRFGVGPSAANANAALRETEKATAERDAEARALEEEKIQRELERAVKHQEVERAKRAFREDRAKAESAFAADEERRTRDAEKAIAKLVRTTESGVGGRKGPNADDVAAVERARALARPIHVQLTSSRERDPEISHKEQHVVYDAIQSSEP